MRYSFVCGVNELSLKAFLIFLIRVEKKFILFITLISCSCTNFVITRFVFLLLLLSDRRLLDKIWK